MAQGELLPAARFTRFPSGRASWHAPCSLAAITRMIDVRTLSFALLVGTPMGCGSSAGDAAATTAGTDGASSDDASHATMDSAGPQREGGSAGSDATTDSDGPHGEGGSPGADGAGEAMSDSGAHDAEGGSPTFDAPSDGRQDSTSPGDAGSSPCTVVSDCRKFSNYCGGCVCDALGTSQPDPICDAGTVTCILDPCQGHTAVCDPTGHCALQ